MNLEFLTNELIPLREKEIEEGKNLATSQPIYVVLDLVENCVSGHSEYSPITNYRNKSFERGYIDDATDLEFKVFKKTDKRMKNPSEVTRFYTDSIVAFFLTSKGAHDYLKYQAHNLENAYVYVFYSGYGNKEMNSLLNGN